MPVISGSMLFIFVVMGRLAGLIHVELGIWQILNNLPKER